MEKWYFIAVGVFMAAAFGAMAVSSKAKSDCKIAAIQAHATVDVIEVCNKE